MHGRAVSVSDATRLVEEADGVVTAGSVATRRRDGDKLNLRFCDVCIVNAGKIRHTRSV